MTGEDQLLGTGRTGGRDATTGVIMGRYAISVGCPDTEPPHGWTWTALSSIAQLESGHTPSRKHPEYWDGVIPWIGIKDATENHGRTISDTNQHVSRLGLENSSARLLPANTVCLSRTASVGFVVVMGRPMATSQDFVNWVCGPGIEPQFLKYVLLAENEALWRFASGTTHQTIYYPEAKAFHVCLPPLPEQRRIAKILGDLDDKIELNRKMNETLEQMARALFKSWFVDFDPVRAKMEGRTPTGMDAATAALFPDRLVDSELGLIPEGWEVKALGEVMDVARQSINPAAQPFEVFAHYSLPAFDTGRVPVRQRGDEIKSNKLLLTDGSVLISKLNPHIPRVWLPTLDPTEHSVCSTEFIVAIASPTISKEYLYCLLCSGDFQQTYQGLATGTTGSHQRIQAESLLSLSQVVAPDDVVAMFTLNLKSMITTINHNIHQSRTLSTLRDTLLPKLVGGELTISS